MSLVDIGLNLTSSQFNKDRDAVISRALSAGVSQFILTGTDVSESQFAFELTDTFPSTYSTAGVHPHDAKSVSQEYLIELKALLQHDKVVAIGECGLDFNRNYSPPDVQERVFAEQLALTADISKPLFMHERDASERFCQIFDEHASGKPGVVHCFTGSKKALMSYLDRGLYIGITGWLCDERRGGELRELVSYIPSDRLLVETDAPWLLPRDLKPKPASRRNEPAYLPHIVQAIASLTNQSVESVTCSTAENSRALFQLR